MEHIFFLPEEEFSELLTLQEINSLQDGIYELSARETGIQAFTAPAVGLYPFEFRLRNYAADIVYTYENNILRFDKVSGPFASGYHLGHKVDAVLK